MFVRPFILAVVTAILLSGCSPRISLWRHEATLVLDRVRLSGADRLSPEEYRSAEEAMHAGERLVVEGEVDEADRYFLLAMTKGNLLEELHAEDKKRQEEQRRQDAMKLELQKQKEKEMEEELRRRQEKELAAAEAKPQPEIKKKPEKPRPKERSFPAYHTTKRGETLPLIAAQPEVYNDPALWPLLYRGNRDQIKDPRHIWPGQVLRIPRNVSRDDMAEARRYAQERPIY